MIRIYADGRKALEIFERFQVDENLPKHRHTATGEDVLLDGQSREENMTPAQFDLRFRGRGQVQDRGRRVEMRTSNSLYALYSSSDITGDTKIPRMSEPPVVIRTGFLASVLFWFKRKRDIRKAEKDPAPASTPPRPVETVFQLVCDNDEVLASLAEKVAKFKTLIDKAAAMGQTALAETLTDRMEVRLLEASLVEHGHTRILTEAKMIEFAEGCEKGLRLDWIANFARVIPDSVVALKRKMDDLLVFDNYVVLHYDPEGKATVMTKEEVRKARDPILFGVIAASRVLYYVGDWKDDLCDLTWEQILDKLGPDGADGITLTSDLGKDAVPTE